MRSGAVNEDIEIAMSSPRSSSEPPFIHSAGITVNKAIHSTIEAGQRRPLSSLE